MCAQVLTVDICSQTSHSSYVTPVRMPLMAVQAHRQTKKGPGHLRSVEPTRVCARMATTPPQRACQFGLKAPWPTIATRAMASMQGRKRRGRTGTCWATRSRARCAGRRLRRRARGSAPSTSCPAAAVRPRHAPCTCRHMYGRTACNHADEVSNHGSLHVNGMGVTRFHGCLQAAFTCTQLADHTVAARTEATRFPPAPVGAQDNSDCAAPLPGAQGS